jgi:membrane associated rhomboid family serine protease
MRVCRRTPHAFATPTLVGLNVVVFVVMVAAGVPPLNPDAMTLLRWGGDLAPRTVNGEWWRLATSMFIHAGALHLALNMFGLIQVALIVERLVGSACFVTVYAVTGFVASLASLYVHPASVSVGASGAIFGIYGFGFAIFAKVSGSSLIEIVSANRKSDDEPSVISLDLSSTDAANSWPTETAADAAFAMTSAANDLA